MNDLGDRAGNPGALGDHAALDAGLVAERYVLGQLAAEERDAFEEHFLDCPTCLERLELARRLHDGLAQVATEEGVKAAVVGHLGLFAALSRLGRRGQVALAAAVLAVVLLPMGRLAVREGRLADLEEALRIAHAPQTPAALVTLGPVRAVGAPPSTRITLPESAGWTVFVLELRDPSSAHYRAILRRGMEVVWQGEDLVPTERGEVVLSLHSTLLTAGDHVLELSAQAASGEAVIEARFAFAIAKP